MEQEQVMELLDVINRLLREVKRREIHDPIPRGEFFVMRLISRYCKEHEKSGAPGITVTALARAMEMPSASASRILRVMERKGYIRRILDDNDRRVVYICLSPEGNRIIAAQRRKVEKGVRAIVARFGEEDSQEMLRLLRRLLSFLQEGA